MLLKNQKDQSHFYGEKNRFKPFNMSLQFKSLQQLNSESINYQYNEQLSLNFYFKLCDQLLNKTFAIFDYQKWKLKLKFDDSLKDNVITDNAMEWCYILQMRYLDLVNNKLTSHSEFLVNENSVQLMMIRKQLIHRIKDEVPLIIENVEWLKEQLKRKYKDLERNKHHELLNDLEAKKIQDLKKLVKEETDFRKEAVLKYNLHHTSDEFNSNIQLSRQHQIEKDQFIQSIKRKTQIQQHDSQQKKIKYGVEDLVSSLSTRSSSGYSLPVLTPHASSDNLSLLDYNTKNNSNTIRNDENCIKYTLPKL